MTVPLWNLRRHLSRRPGSNWILRVILWGGVAIASAILAACATGSTSPTSPSKDVAPTGTVTVGTVRMDACPTSAAPLPGWRNCTGSVQLTITKTIAGGVVSVFFSYPDSGSFFHGQTNVYSGTTSYTVQVVNEYVSHCVRPYTTSIDVYGGAQNASSAPLLTSYSVTFSGSC